MKLLLSCLMALSLVFTTDSEKKGFETKKEETITFNRGTLANSKITYNIYTVNRGRYVKVEFMNDYDKPVLIEGIIDGVLINGKKDYKIKIKPNSRKSVLIRYIKRKIYPAEECNNFSPYDACADTKREILFKYNRFDTSLISVLNNKIELLESKD